MAHEEHFDELRAVKRGLGLRRRVATTIAIGLGLLFTSLVALCVYDPQQVLFAHLEPVRIIALIGLLATIAVRLILGARIRRLASFEAKADGAFKLGDSSSLRSCMNELVDQADSNSDFAAVISRFWPRLSRRLEDLLDREARLNRAAKIAQLCEEADRLVKDALCRQHESKPHVRAKLELEQALSHLRKLVAEADRQFEEALEKKFLKAWATITRPGRKELRKARDQIKALEAALANVSANSELIVTEREYEDLLRLIDQRLSTAKKLASEALPASHHHQFEPDHALSIGLIAAAMSVPVSVAMDLGQAGSVYDALRDVNGNYAGLTDLEIWQESLTMSAESLAGLAALTKGSYFEGLVENELGGERFANFNHPDTDIVIDGVAFQIKATDNAAYVDSVADHIPVVTTTEVAELTGSIDIGYSDLDLTEAVDLALGGSVIDFGDTLLDGISTGIGGVGIVAIIRGANAAWGKYRSGGNAASALGAGVTATAAGIARTFVNVAELGYRGGQIATRTIVRLGSSDKKLVDEDRKPRSGAPKPSEYKVPFDSHSDNIIYVGSKPLKS